MKRLRNGTHEEEVSSGTLSIEVLGLDRLNEMSEDILDPRSWENSWTLGYVSRGDSRGLGFSRQIRNVETAVGMNAIQLVQLVC